MDDMKNAAPCASKPVQGMSTNFGVFKKQITKQVFVWLGLLFLLIFNITPMLGVITAFKEYQLRTGFIGIFTGDFVGLRYFKEFFTDRKFADLLANTLTISFLKIIAAFPLPILFAIMISEMRGRKYKRIVQTASYLPHFISWVIVAGVFFAFFSTTNGVLNEILMNLKLIKEPIPILYDSKYYYFLAVISDIWKETGWGAIIYLAAISGIDPTLYESAQIDGAGRLRRIWHITIPCIKGTIAVMLILGIGGIIYGNFDQTMLLQNTMNISRSEILDTYIYKIGLSQGRYSYAAAAGLFQSLVSLVLVLTTNRLSRKISGASLF